MECLTLFSHSPAGSVRPTTIVTSQTVWKQRFKKVQAKGIQPSQVCGENLVKEESCMLTYLGVLMKGKGSLSFRKFEFGYYAVL